MEDIDPMFEWVANILDGNATGVIVTLVLGLEAFLRDRHGSKARATIRDYLEWLRREDHRELLRGQQCLVDRLQEGGEQSRVLQCHVERILQTVQEFGGNLAEICQQVERIPDMDRKLDLLIARLTNAAPNQVLIDARVLEVLASGLTGAGVQIALHRANIHEAGTLMVRWRLGVKSPRLMLADCVGGVHENRLSLILNEDASLLLRAYDASGSVTEITSPSHGKSEYLIAFALWSGADLAVWTNNQHRGSARMRTPFQCLGPTVLFGIDIEGTLSADAVRPSPTGALKMGMSYLLDWNGFNLQKDGVWHGSRYDAQVVWQRALEAPEVQELTLDPTAMLQRRRDYERSVRELDLAIINEPDDPTLRIARAITYSWTGDFPHAITEFGEAIRIAPAAMDSYLLRGVAHNIVGNLGQAIADYRIALTIDRRNADVHNRLAWLFATSSEPGFRCGEDALEHARDAHQLAPWRPDILDTLAAALAENGDFSGAVNFQQQAVATRLDRDKGTFETRLGLYMESHPYRDEAWHSLRQVWRHSQMFDR